MRYINDLANLPIRRMTSSTPVSKRRKATQFREILRSPGLEFLMEAHNGISARASSRKPGFRGIWASGLSISASLGVRDNNEASWTQVLEVVEFMSDATSIPILLDGDTGYGNFNNMRRLVRKLEQRGVAAVCIEDKLFPKTNSFIKGERQPLADVEEFSGKIKAVKEAQSDPDFCLVARWKRSSPAGDSMRCYGAPRRVMLPERMQCSCTAKKQRRIRCSRLPGRGRTDAHRHRAHDLLQHANRIVRAGRNPPRDLG